MVDVVSDQTEISFAESVTNWSGDSFVLDNEVFVQGSNAVNCNQTNNGINDAQYDGSWDMTNSHVRCYMSTNISANMDTVNAIQLYIVSGAGTAYWTVANTASDYAGGWQDFFIDINSTPTTGTVAPATVTAVGFRINTATKPRNAVNGWYDNFRFGNGITINSTAAEAINFNDVAIEDGLAANKFDILQLVDGVLFGKGELILGDTGAKNCNLVSVNEQVVFVDRTVAADLYKIQTQIGTGTTDIDISGLVCKTVGVSAAELLMSTSVTSFSITGSTFIGMGAMSFPAMGSQSGNSFTSCGTTTLLSGHTVTGNNWNNSGVISPTGATLVGGTVQNAVSTTGALVITSPAEMTAITDMSFNNNNRAIEITTAGIYSFNGHQFSGNTIQVNFSGTGTCEINPSNGCNVAQLSCEATGGGTIQVNAISVNFTINISPVPSPNYEWRIYTVTAIGSMAGAVEIAATGAESATTGTEVVSHTFTGQPVAVQILSNDYEESLTYYTLDSSNLTVTINLEIDNND